MSSFNKIDHFDFNFKPRAMKGVRMTSMFLLLSSVVTALPALTSLSGWSPCGITGSSEHARCNTYTAPLCYPGRCVSSKSINVFVKGIPRKTEDTRHRALWVLDGGPGVASVTMEPLVSKLYSQLGGAWSIYTMDHRGTGRSERLTCDMGTSTAGIVACVNSLHDKYGDNAAGFSVTSAASDIVALSETIDSNAEWFVYGVSYGTYLTERVVHLSRNSSTSFQGFILDGVIPETMKIPNAEADYAAIGNRFLEACDADAACHAVMGPEKLRDRIAKFYLDIDKPNAPEFCREWLQNQAGNGPEKPSYAAKKLFASLIRDASTRNLFFPLFTKLARCNERDHAALDAMDEFIDDDDVYEDNFTNDFDSPVLYDVIAYSERQIWFNEPTPSLAKLRAQFEAEIIAEGFYEQLAVYCLYINHADDACDELQLPPTDSFTYKPDEYFDKVGVLPSTASLLMMNGDLDLITPDNQAKYQFDAYDTSKKLYANVTSAGHSVADTPCGYEILLSYLQQNGDVTKVDTSCLSRIPFVSFGITNEVAKEIFETLDDVIPITQPRYPTTTSSSVSNVPSKVPTPNSAIQLSITLAASVVGLCFGYQ